MNRLVNEELSLPLSLPPLGVATVTQVTRELPYLLSVLGVAAPLQNQGPVRKAAAAACLCTQPTGPELQPELSVLP